MRSRSYTGDVSASWESTYKTKQASERSWTQGSPAESLELLDLLDLRSEDPIIDICGGSSTFVDALIARSYSDLSVLDISPTAIRESAARIASIHGADVAIEWI